MPDVLILCYHAVSEEWPAPLSVAPGRLRAQIELLLGRGYAGRTLSDAATAPPRRCLVVTFDDAFESVVERAYPLLRELAVPATVFVPTEHVGKPGPMTWPGIDRWLGTPHEPELAGASWEQLGELAQAGWEIGSHTRTHPHLTALDDRSLREELEGSRAECERRLGVPCRTIAYPYGDVDDRVTRAAQAAGYELGVSLPTTLRVDHAFNRPRVGIYRADAGWRFRMKVSTVVRRLRASPAWGAVDAARRRG